MGEQAAYLRPNELNGLASSRIGLVFCVLEREAGGRPARNDLQYMVCWWESRGLVHRPSSLPLRYGWKEHGGFAEVDVGPSTLRSRI
jgi:hypothetical protein